jgi:hypothetical protein
LDNKLKKKTQYVNILLFSNCEIEAFSTCSKKAKSDVWTSGKTRINPELIRAYT